MLPIDETTAIKLIPTNQYTFEQLADIYNQTRIDYIVPMPMNATRLAEYVKLYDVSLEHSMVATLNHRELLGIIMIGVREGRAWVTRLGTIPINRRLGVGRALMDSLIEQAQKLSINFCMLEVIKNNIPAHKMFLKFGFREVSELLVLRRPPISKTQNTNLLNIKTLERQQTLTYINQHPTMLPWTNQLESFENAEEVSGFHVTLEDGTSGWLAYQRQKFLLSHFILKTETGNPISLANALLSHIHQQYPRLDTQVENIRADDPHLPAFYESGYIESFRRIEMWLGEFA